MHEAKGWGDEDVQEGVVRKLRDGQKGPVYGVRTRVACSCGLHFYVTLTVGVDAPILWCPHCKSRSRLHVRWRLDGPVVEGAKVRWSLH